MPRAGFELTIPVFQWAKTVMLRTRSHCDRQVCVLWFELKRVEYINVCSVLI
jgi:hypothetical protein